MKRQKDMSDVYKTTEPATIMPSMNLRMQDDVKNCVALTITKSYKSGDKLTADVQARLPIKKGKVRSTLLSKRSYMPNLPKNSCNKLF